MTRESEIEHIINLHKLWQSSNHNQGKRADFSGANLDGISLANNDLNGALFCGASLKKTNLSNCKLFHADFSDADLTNANLTGSILILANFSGADLTNANLAETKNSDDDQLKHSRGPTFREANLDHTNFNKAYCVASDFTEANCLNTNFLQAKLAEANFSRCNLSGLNFSLADANTANMSECNLSNVNLQKAKLWHINFSNSNLEHSDIREAQLQSANFENCKVDNIIYNRKTLFKGIRTRGCYGSSRFKRFANDQDYLEEFREAHPVAYAIWLGLTDCGRSMLRVASWSAFLTLSYAAIYFSLGKSAFSMSNTDGLEWNLFTTLYYSVVTFTTLGFGDITPNTPLAASLVMSEVIIGYIMLGILISILATKVARRS